MENCANGATNQQGLQQRPRTAPTAADPEKFARMGLKKEGNFVARPWSPEGNLVDLRTYRTAPTPHLLRKIPTAARVPPIHSRAQCTSEIRFAEGGFQRCSALCFVYQR